MNRFFKIIVKIVLPVILLMFILFLVFLPYGLKKYINEHGKDYIGRKIAVQDIKVNYFRTSLSVFGFKMFESDGVATFVSFDTLQLKISPFPLFASKLEVRQLRLVGPVINIVRKDTLYNFDDLIAFFNSKPETEPQGKKSEPFKYFLNNLSMEQGRLVFTDKTVDHTTVMKDLNFFIPSLYFNEAEMKDAGIRFHFENGGSLQAKTTYNMESGAYAADIKIDNLDISPFLPYTREYLKISQIDGSAGGDFHVSGNISQPDSLLFRGTGQVANFSMKDEKGSKVLGARQTSVSFRDSYPLRYNFEIDSLHLTEPYLFVEMKDSTVNLLNLMVETPAESGAKTASVSDTQPFTYHIRKFRIEEGTMDLCDNSFEEPFNYNLGNIEMKVDSIFSDSKWLNTYSSMKLNKRGKLQAEFGFNPSDPYELKINYVITNFQLTDLNIYSRHYVGFPILLGNMYYKGNTVIAGKKLKSENKLIIRNAQLGERSGGIINLPLRLAVYLLKDIHGDIILDIPLSGDLNDPKTKIGRLIWQTLKNLVVKVVASPFIALGNLMGVEPSETKGLEFNYADSTLTEKNLKRIGLFTEIEKKKPDMNIVLVSLNDPGLERKDIALEETGKLFYKATGEDYRKEEAKFHQFIAGKLQSDTISTERGSILLIGENRLDSLQQAFSQARIRQVEAALKKADATTKIKVEVAPKEVPENVGSRPVFELRCNLAE